MVRSICTALILLIVSAEVLVAAKAQEANDKKGVILLSCDGTVSTVGYKTPEHKKNMEVAVNVSARTVIGVGDVIANIDQITAKGIGFSGYLPLGRQGRRAGETSVVGFLSRINVRGRPSLYATRIIQTVNSKTLLQKYSLSCKRISKLKYFDISPNE